MNRFPRLSEEAYKDDKVHHAEVIDMIADYAVDMWRYYKSKSLTDVDIALLKNAVIKSLPK